MLGQYPKGLPSPVFFYLFHTERVGLVRTTEVQKDGFPGRDS